MTEWIIVLKTGTMRAAHHLFIYGTTLKTLLLGPLRASSCSRKVRAINDAYSEGIDLSFSEGMAPASPNEPSGSWDSVHVFEAVERGRQAHYKLTSTIMLQLLTHQSEGKNTETDKRHNSRGGDKNGWEGEGEVSLSGSMTRQVCRYTSILVQAGSDVCCG